MIIRFYILSSHSFTLMPTGSDPDEVRWSSRPEHRRRQRPCQSPLRNQWTRGFHLKGIVLLFHVLLLLFISSTVTLSCAVSGYSSWLGMSEWPACWRPDIRGELHWPASCHTSRSCTSPACQQAGDLYVSAQGPFTTGDAGRTSHRISIC